MQPFASRIRACAVETSAALRSDLIIYWTALFYLVGGLIYVLSQGQTIIAEYDVYAMGCIALCCIVLPYLALVAGAGRIALFFPRQHRRFAWRMMVSPRRIGRGIAGTLLMLMMLLLFEAMYMSVKTAFSSQKIPFDPMIADIDKALHFGRAPAHWLAFLRSDWMLRLVETNYDMVWFPLWIGLLYWFCVTPRLEALRVRFVMTFMLTWVFVGNIIAAFTLTAGPALYGLATGDQTRFEKLANFLQSTPNSTAATQQYLWSLHEAGSGGLGSGISAFPSMHVAVTTVCALFLSEISPRFRIPAWTYVAIICASSVFLGWHYAVDGYASIVLTVGLYWAVRGAPHLLRLRWRPIRAEARRGVLTGESAAS